MLACNPCRAESKLWEPITAVEFNVSWDSIRGKERSNAVLQNITSSHIIGPFKIERRRRELLVRMSVQGTERSAKDTDADLQDRSRWPPPQVNNKSFILTSKCERELVKCLLSSICHLTLRLQLFRRRAVSESDLAWSLNEARLAGCALCDVVLEADGKEFRAHKAVLCARSPVFKTMLTGNFKEKGTGHVAMKDVSKEAIEKFLHFLYAGFVADWGLCEFELLNLAEQYEVKRLHALCELRLWGLEDGVRALSLLLEAPKWPVVREEVRSRLASLVAANWSTVKDSETWQQAKAEAREPTLVSIVHAFATIGEISRFQPSTETTASSSPTSSPSI